MTAQVTVSVVSHRQQALVASLLQDLAALASPQVAAIIVTRNVPEAPQPVPPSLEARTTLVDNAVARGFGANHNAAFARCTTPFFAILNPDLRLSVDPFPSLVARLTASVAVTAPRIVARDGRPEDAARKLVTPWRLLQRRLLRREREPAREPDWLAGMFLVVRSDAFRAVGGFDERFFMYCEDCDLCARLALRGWSFVVDERVEVVHDAQRASHGSWRHLRWHVTSLLKMWSSSAFWQYRQRLREQHA